MRAVYDFFSSNGYVLEILLSVFFFTWWMEKRRGFWIRSMGVLTGMLLVSMLLGLIPFENAGIRSMRTIAFFVLCIGGVKLCYRIAAAQAVFYVTAASAAQHFAYKASGTLLMPVWRFGEPSDYPLVLDLGYPLLFVAFSGLCYLLFGKKLRKEDIDHLTSSPMVLFLLIGMQLCTNIFQNLLDEYGMGYEVCTIVNLFDIVCCLFLLSLQCEIARKENEQQNNEIMKHILYQQKQQMKISRETIDLINIKCHDIKNQIAMLGSHVPQDELSELKRAITIYDTALKTGNEALDVLLVEKLMICERKNIRVDCMIRGELLSFMKQSDIYSLFGNAIDNAVEAVDKLSDPDRRFISIRGREDKGMLMLHFENFHEGKLSFEDGLPETTKQDKRYHGFGMKSIRMITKKYQGYFNVKAQNGIFTLNILLPIPKEGGAA